MLDHGFQKKVMFGTKRGKTIIMNENHKSYRDMVLKIFALKVPEGKTFSRIGSHYDGGYVTVNDFSSNDYLLSFGVETNVDFEHSISNIISGMDLYDYSIESVPSHLKNYRFYKEKIGKNSHYVFDRVPKEKDIILKIDIEGGEWPFFESLDHEDISKFRQIIMEIHWGIQNEEINSPEIRLDILEKINKTHQIIAIHPNNWAGICYINNIAIPQVMELTFLRKSDYVFVEGTPPKNLFYPNNPNLYELEFDIDKNYKEAYDRYLGNIAFPVYDDLISKSINQDGIWEENEFNWVIKNVKEGDVCINIGANVGYFTCVMSRKTGKTGKVFSIEANPEFDYFLNKNIERTNMDNVSLIMSAAGNVSGTTELFINSNNCGDNRVFNPNIIKNASSDRWSNTREVVSVPIDKVDNLVFSDKVDVVLIDCQGWDHEVIRGMKGIIEKNKPKILTEFVPKWLVDLGEDPIDILKEYQDFGYDLLCPDLEINDPFDANKLLEEMKIKGLWFTNIYLRPKIINSINP